MSFPSRIRKGEKEKERGGGGEGDGRRQQSPSLVGAGTPQVPGSMPADTLGLSHVSMASIQHMNNFCSDPSPKQTPLNHAPLID